MTKSLFKHLVEEKDLSKGRGKGNPNVNVKSPSFDNWSPLEPVGGALADGDYGNITVSSGGTLMTVDDNVVTNALLSNMAAWTVKVRNANTTGDPSDANAAAITTETPVSGDFVLGWLSTGELRKYDVSDLIGGGLISENVSITGGNVGTVLRVTATATGTTCSYSGGIFTVTIPIGVTLISAHLIITTADVQVGADGGGFTQWISVKFEGTDGNTGIATLRVPHVQKCNIPSAGALAVNNSASIDIDNNPAMSVTAVGSNSITVRVNGLSVSTQGYLLSFNGF